MDIQKEREAFECEFKQTDYYIAHGDLSTLMLCDDQYALDDVQVSFEMWQAAKAQAVPEWVSVDDKLPAIGVYVMVFLEKQGHNPTTYNFCQYTKFGFHLSNVTHWMPLPDAPKAQEQKG